VFWVILVYFNIRNTLPKSGTFLLGHPVYKIYVETIRPSEISHIPGEELNVSYFSVGNDDIGRPL